MMTLSQSNAPPFVPADFVVPAGLETAEFRLRMRSAADVAKNYPALLENADLFRAIFGCDWPTTDFTRAENLRDLTDHKAAFLSREAFVSTVTSLDETTCLGCGSISPPRGRPWVRQSACERGLNPVLLATVKAWIGERWPFRSALNPDRADDGAWQPLNGAVVYAFLPSPIHTCSG